MKMSIEFNEITTICVEKANEKRVEKVERTSTEVAARHRRTRLGDHRVALRSQEQQEGPTYVSGIDI